MKYLKILSVIGSLALSLIATSAFGAERLKMATIAPGTSAYLTMTTFASLVNQNQNDFDITVDATGAATKHGIELAKGKLDFCMSAPTVHFFLKNAYCSLRLNAVTSVWQKQTLINHDQW